MENPIKMGWGENPPIFGKFQTEIVAFTGLNAHRQGDLCVGFGLLFRSLVRRQKIQARFGSGARSNRTEQTPRAWADLGSK